VFTQHHGVTPEVAIDEIRFLARHAIEHGNCSRTPRGRQRLSVEKFVLVIDATGKMVLGYRTRHFERVPSQVFGGVPSRFGAARRAQRATRVVWDRGTSLATEEARASFDPSAVIVLPGALHSYAKSSGGLNKNDPDTLMSLRERLTADSFGGEWSPGNDGAHLITHDGRIWVIGSDGGVVITTFCPDTPPNRAG
jgi:hypothetical protein